MKTEIKTIWPDEAKYILKHKNKINRNLSEIFVKKIANDILNDTFILTHQGIAFDTEGNLLDGQHRLAACIKANKPIKILVTYDVPKIYQSSGVDLNSFEIIDSGRTRTVGQMLNIGGLANATAVAATAKVIALLCARSAFNVGITTSQVHKILDITKKSIHTCVKISKGGSILKAPSWITAPAALYHCTFPDKAEQFLSEFVNLSTPDKEGFPSRALAHFYKNNPAAGGGSQQIAWVKYPCYAIHCFHTGKKVSKISASDISNNWILGINEEITRQISSVIKI
jgi:hypothetical protein